MRASYLRRGVLLALTVGAAACTEPSATPTTPTTTTLVAPQVTGMFQGPMTLSFVSGGGGPIPDLGIKECIGNALTDRIGSVNNASLALTQDGTAVTGRLVSRSTGLSCSYSGSLGKTNSFVLDGPLPTESCTAASDFTLACPLPDGTYIAVGITPSGSSITGSFDGWPLSVSGLHGTAATSYGIYTGDHKYYAGLVVNQDLAFTKQ